MIENKDNYISNFVASIGVKNEKKLEPYLEEKVAQFFDNLGVIKPKPIKQGYEISDKDFIDKNENKEISFASYFYKYIVNSIEKQNSKVSIQITYCLTLDKENCTQTCDKTGILYDVICLYKKPVFYFIYIDITEIFKILRSQDTSNDTQKIVE